MLPDEIVVGKSYVNNEASIIREVVGELDYQRVQYNAFELGTGRLSASRHRVCDRRELARWADREALPVETARIHPYASAAVLDAQDPSDSPALRPEEARAAFEAGPGTHSFPRPR